MGGIDVTYRERALKAEARLAELEEELATWRGQRAAERAEIQAETQRCDLARKLRPYLDTRHRAPQIARLILCLLRRPGELCGKWALRQGISTHIDIEELESARVVDVTVCQARAALRKVGLGDAIETVWGKGYRVPVDRAEALRAWCEGRA